MEKKEDAGIVSSHFDPNLFPWRDLPGNALKSMGFQTGAESTLPDKLMIVRPPEPKLPRTIWVHGFYYPRDFVEQFYNLLAEDGKKDILVAIDSFGGSVYGLNQILSVIEVSPVDVRTCVFGVAMSAGFVLASAGTKGKRSAMPNATGMMHQASAWSGGTISQMESDLDEAKRLNESMLKKISDNTGNSVSDLEAIIKEKPESFYDAEGLVKFGLVDAVVKNLMEILPAKDEPEAGTGSGGEPPPNQEGADG